MLKHFGLVAYFAAVRNDAKASSAWPKHKNYDWHDDCCELKTTACYLVLPRQIGRRVDCEASEMEYEFGSIVLQSSKASFITMPTLDDKEKRVRQFQLALRTLELSPYVHTSQLRDTVSAHMTGQVKGEGSSDGKQDAKSADKENLEDSKIPRVTFCSPFAC